MSLLRHGLEPSKLLSLAACACLSAAASLLSGCASDKPPSYVQGPSPQQLAAIRKVEIEDDGQPVQAPPARAISAEEDDPSQPWSRNYGGSGLPAPGRTIVPATPSQPYVAPAPRSTGTLTRLSEVDADLVMAQAISAHEMRRQ